MTVFHHNDAANYLSINAKTIFQGAGHNDVELYSHYLDRLRHFVAEELPN